MPRQYVVLIGFTRPRWRNHCFIVYRLEIKKKIPPLCDWIVVGWRAHLSDCWGSSVLRLMAGDDRSWQNHAFQIYRRRHGDNQFEEKRSHALQVSTSCCVSVTCWTVWLWTLSARYLFWFIEYHKWQWLCIQLTGMHSARVVVHSLVCFDTWSR